MSGVRGSERGEVWSRDRHVAVMRVTETVAGKRDGRVSEWWKRRSGGKESCPVEQAGRRMADAGDACGRLGLGAVTGGRREMARTH